MHPLCLALTPYGQYPSSLFNPVTQRLIKHSGQDTFENVPFEIIERIMIILDPSSQLCFSLTGARFRKIFGDCRGQRNFQSYIHSNSFSPRLSLSLSTQVSVCGKHIWDVDSHNLGDVPTLSDTGIQWYPSLGELLWNEPLLWGSGGQWCDGCSRVLPRKSWEECNFERRFWDVLPRSRHRLITDLLAEILVENVRREDDSEEDLAVMLSEFVGSDELKVYESKKEDFDYNLCTKCRLRHIITDKGRRPGVWQEKWEDFVDQGIDADALAMNGGVAGKYNRYEVISFNRNNFRGMSDPTRTKSVPWKDIWRACGIFVKEYVRREVPKYDFNPELNDYDFFPGQRVIEQATDEEESEE